MAQTSFPIGAIDKNGLNVKTPVGWRGVVSHFNEVKAGLKINARHKERIKEIRTKLRS